MDFERLAQAVGDLNEPEVMAIVQEIVESDRSSAYESLKAFQKGMEIVGERFDSCEYFVGDLIFAGEVMTRAVNILRPALQEAFANKAPKKKVMICTVEGDLHDIGKNILKAILDGRGIEVIDLGVNKSPAVIVEAAIAEDVDVVALSGVLTYARESMIRTVEAFENAGIRNKVKIIIGGSCVTKDTYKLTGADAWAESPREGADICIDWLS